MGIYSIVKVLSGHRGTIIHKGDYLRGNYTVYAVVDASI